jgi:hypothetical protein
MVGMADHEEDCLLGTLKVGAEAREALASAAHLVRASLEGEEMRNQTRSLSMLLVGMKATPSTMASSSIVTTKKWKAEAMMMTKMIFPMTTKRRSLAPNVRGQGIAVRTKMISAKSNKWQEDPAGEMSSMMMTIKTDIFGVSETMGWIFAWRAKEVIAA